MRRSGLEWLYRLAREPRLAGRYLRNNPRFLLEILRRPPRILPAEGFDA
jgi:UDP-N-acetyl-D-mannosaminuronic acid transferase (WecB/TagA/CpsF family)